MKKYLSILVTTILSLVALTQTAFATSGPVTIGLNNAYPKPDGTYAVVVRDKPDTKLALYVNDANPVYATANKQNWATFRGVQLPNGSGKISFAKVFKTDGKTYQKPINYARYYSVANNLVTFVAKNPAEPAAPAAQTKPVAQSTPAPAPTPTYVAPQPTCANGSYINSAGNRVCNPEAAPSTPAGATAQCVDGTYSFSQSHSGTCSHHGGVSAWL